MKTQQIQIYQMLTRVVDFRAKREGLFPKHTVADAMFAAIGSAVTKLSAEANAEVSGIGAVRTSNAGRKAGRQALNAQVDVSMSQRNQALYNYENTVRNAFKEVNDSLDAIARLQEQLDELQEQATVAQEALRIAHNRYRNGYASYLDELDAQRTLYSVQTSVVQVKK